MLMRQALQRIPLQPWPEKQKRRRQVAVITSEFCLPRMLMSADHSSDSATVHWLESSLAVLLWERSSRSWSGGAYRNETSLIRFSTGKTVVLSASLARKTSSRPPPWPLRPLAELRTQIDLWVPDGR